MRHRSLLAACAALALLLAPGPKASAANVSFSLRIGDPYPGPHLVFAQQPDIVLIPGTRVYYIDDYDYDLYRYGSYWYYYYDGGWYRSYDYDGPFYFIGYQSVPYSIRYIPTRYRHHWRSYRGPAYSYYRAGRYYRTNPYYTTQRSTTQRTTTYEGRSYPKRRYQQPAPERGTQYRQQQARQRQQAGQVQRGQQRTPPSQQNRGGGDRGGGKGKGKDKGQGRGHGQT